MNITILGHVCIDNNISESVTYTTAGSPALFMDKVYKNFSDVSTHIIAPYGMDFLPYITQVNIFPKKPTSDWTLIYENKSHGNIRSQKALNREYAKPLTIDTELQNIAAKSDILFFAPLTPDYTPKYVESLMRLVKSDTLKILMPQGYYRSFDEDNNVIEREFTEARTIVPIFDFVIVSEQDHKNMKEIVEKWARVTHVIMTLGDKGSSYFHKDNYILESTESVKLEDIIDSVGSGDIFSAAFGYKYYKTKDIKKSLKFANTIARQCLFYPANNLQFVISE